MRKHYVEYVFPGLIFSDSKVEPIKDRKAKVRQPRGAYAYRFFSREEKRENGEVLKGEPKDYSGWRYFEGEILTLEAVKRDYPSHDIVIKNMQFNHYDRVVHCPNGGFYPMEKKDRILKEIDKIKAIKREIGYKQTTDKGENNGSESKES